MFPTKSTYPINILCGLIGTIFLCSCQSSIQKKLKEQVIANIKQVTIQKAASFLTSRPITVTASICKRSSGGKHDFYSEGDYWWPDPKNPNGPYIRKDGQSNPNNFSDHRLAMIRLNDIVATLTSAWLLNHKPEYLDKIKEHLNAWFIDTTTMMSPNMSYAQAVWGRYTGRGIGIIDAYHLVEVAQSVKILTDRGAIRGKEASAIKNWFAQFLNWMTTTSYGINEMNAKNNHGTCWAVTASMFARLTGNQAVIDLCKERFKHILLPTQMAKNGSFPLELIRTKPYGYSLFNMDAMANLAEILSTPKDNLWNYVSPGGKSLKKGMEFIYPYIRNKTSWPYKQDIYIWKQWPVRQSSLLFAGLAYTNASYIATYLKLPDNPTHPEVIRNLPVRHPLIWLLN